MKKTKWTAVAVAIFAFAAVSAQAQSIYFDVLNNAAGFGSPSGSYNSNTAVWNTNSDGSGANLAAWPGAGNYGYTGIMTFGAAGSDFAGNTFTMNYVANGGVGGIVVNSTSANITIGGGAVMAATQTGSWTVATGSTLTMASTWNGIGFNWNSQNITLNGGGTINFDTAVLYNGGTSIGKLNAPPAEPGRRIQSAKGWGRSKHAIGVVPIPLPPRGGGGRS